jgi:hypothetical protein
MNVSLCYLFTNIYVFLFLEKSKNLEFRILRSPLARSFSPPSLPAPLYLTLVHGQVAHCCLTPMWVETCNFWSCTCTSKAIHPSCCCSAWPSRDTLSCREHLEIRHLSVLTQTAGNLSASGHQSLSLSAVHPRSTGSI